MHRDRPPDHLRVTLAAHIGPGLVKPDFLVESGLSQLGRNPADRLGGNAADLLGGLRTIVSIGIAPREAFEGGVHLTPIRQHKGSVQRGACGYFCPQARCAGFAIPNKRFTAVAPCDEAVIRAPRGCG